MFIKRKNYEKKNKEIKELKGQIEAYKDKILHRDVLIDTLEHDKKNLDDLNNNFRQRLIHLEAANDNLMETNQRLTEWVEKIIKDAGIYEVKEKTAFSIPIYKEPFAAFGTHEEIKEAFLHKDDIIIPEIRIMKYK
jgi:hypothetical protein